MRGLLLVATLFFVSILIVNPVGDFALNDDFSFAEMAKSIYSGEGLVHPPLVSATLISQAAWGALVAKVLGFSYTSLRISSLISCFVGAVACYFLFKELGFGEFECSAASLLLLFNPIYFLLSFSFMTEPHFIALMILSMLFYVKGLRKRGPLYLFMGSLFSMLAFLVRQNGLLIPLGVFGYMIVNRRRFVYEIDEYVNAFLLPLMVCGLYVFWFVGGGMNYSMPQMLAQTVSLQWLPYVPFRIFTAIEYLGLFLLPVMFAYYLSGKMSSKQALLVIALFLVFLFGSALLYDWFGLGFPHLPNIINTGGLGPSYLQGTKTQADWGVMFVFGLVSAAILVTVLLGRLVKKVDSVVKGLHTELFRDESVAVYLIGFLMFGFTLIVGSYFDRYLLPLFVPAILLTFNLAKHKLSKSVLVIWIIIFAATSISGTQDYLAWNRTKMEAVNYLRELGVAEYQIDGGYEFDCERFCEYSLEHPEEHKAKSYDPQWIQHSTPVIDSEYVVSFSSVEGYEVVESFEYFSLLTFDTERIYVNVREE